MLVLVVDRQSVFFELDYGRPIANNCSSLLVIPSDEQLRLLAARLDTAAAPPPFSITDPSVQITMALFSSSSTTWFVIHSFASSLLKSMFISSPIGGSHGGDGNGWMISQCRVWSDSKSSGLTILNIGLLCVWIRFVSSFLMSNFVWWESGAVILLWKNIWFNLKAAIANGVRLVSCAIRSIAEVLNAPKIIWLASAWRLWKSFSTLLKLAEVNQTTLPYRTRDRSTEVIRCLALRGPRPE